MGALGEQLVQAGWRADENQLLVVELSAKFADSDEWARAGYSSAGRWIADRLDVTRRTANEWIRVGRALRELPLTGEALRSKVLSFTKVKVLSRVATAENESELIELAQRVTAAQLPKAIAWWSQQPALVGAPLERNNRKAPYSSRPQVGGLFVHGDVADLGPP
jgi:hypothetical protein